MRKLLLTFVFALFVTPALAQNTTCSDRPPSDSSNACANTRFVHNSANNLPSIANNEFLANTSGATNKPIGTTMNGFFNSICSSAIGQFWVRVSNAWGCSSLGYVNPVWWGADPNGNIDSTAAIQSAIDAAITGIGGFNVFIPGGTFLVSSTINITGSFLTIQGAGSSISYIKRTTNYGDTFLFQGIAPAHLQSIRVAGLNIQFNTVVPTSGANFHFVAADFVTLDDIFASDNFIGIEWDGCNNQLISNVTLIASAGNSTGRIGMLIQKSPPGWGGTIGSGPNTINMTIASSPNTNPGFASDVFISGVDGAWFSNSYFGPASSVNFAITNTDASVSAVTGILVNNSWFDLGHGATLFQMNGTSISNFGNVLLEGNIFLGAAQDDQGINISGNAYGIQIIGNSFDGFQKQAIQFAGTVTDFNVSQNKIANFNRGGSGYAGVEILGSNSVGVISGNIINSGQGGNALGIWLSGTTTKVNVNGNTVTNQNQGVLIDSGVTEFVVTSNLIRGNTTNLTDNSGAVSKLVANNLN